MDFGERSTEGKIYWVPKAEQLKIKRRRLNEITNSIEQVETTLEEKSSEK
jgi:hypothetical protein